MAANMWKNNLKNVECDNNKIIYENLLEIFFYSETVFTFSTSLIHSYLLPLTYYGERVIDDQL